MCLEYLTSAISLIIAVLKNSLDLVVHLLPHVLLLALFALFVLVNGGVVLGKTKANQITDISLP